jgi:hypothetical protein
VSYSVSSAFCCKQHGKYLFVCFFQTLYHRVSSFLTGRNPFLCIYSFEKFASKESRKNFTIDTTQNATGEPT